MATAWNDVLFASELWNRALESYGNAAHLTMKLFDSDAHVIFGPIHPTPLFQLFAETNGYDPGMFGECARRCVAQTNDRPAVIVSEFYGLSVIGTSLMLDGEMVGAAVGGYAFVDFSQLSEVQRLARNSGISFDRLWEVARAQKPVSRDRLASNGQLLQVLGDALLRENHRTRQYEDAVVKLEETGRAKDRANQELQHAASALHRMNEDLKGFAFAASHDLQEPLRTVTVYSQLLVQRAGEQLNGEAARWAGFIEQGTDRMRNLLLGLLAYINIAQTGGEPSHCIGLNDALNSALKNLKEAIQESGASVTSDPLPRVVGQEVHFIQLFQNLIGNAIKYRGPSPPCIRISGQKCGSQWRIAVSDNGMGIDPEYHQTIFGVFKRLHGTKIPGTGIGLSICQRIVERYGGRLWVESQPDAGATFYLTLPIAENEKP
ncbi:MAG: PocR ligand-binding domain-containing protein [Bryobacterales bacterium]|nr:PocR ligand-binding domain-containing protein [Bryobacterales bacterium]